MKRELCEGDKVLIFKYNKEEGQNQSYNIFIKGRVNRKYQNTWNGEVYEVLGSDKNIYIGNYANRVIGNYFFLTLEDYIILLKEKNMSIYKEITYLTKEYGKNSKEIAILLDYYNSNKLPSSDLEVKDKTNKLIKNKRK